MGNVKRNLPAHDEWADTVSRYIREVLALWREDNVAAFIKFLDDDVEFTSPYVVDGVIRGKSAFVSYSIKRRQETGPRTLVDIMLGVGTFTLLLRDRVGHVTWNITTNGRGLVRRVASSFSIGADFGRSVGVVDDIARDACDWGEGAKQRVLRGLDAWRQGDFGGVAELFSDTIEMKSPFIDQGVAIGKSAVLRHIANRQPELRNIRLVDILIGVGKIDLLLDDGVAPQLWELVTDGVGPVSRLLVSYSVGPDFSDGQPTIE